MVACVPGIRPADPVSSQAFREALGRFATGIVVVTVSDGGETHGMTANAFTSGSLEPPLVMVSIGHRARMRRLLETREEFGVTMLAQSEEMHSRHFAGQKTPGFEPHFRMLRGVPVLVGGLASVAARIVHRYRCGDHTLFVGEVLALEVEGGNDPLIFFGGRYATLGATREVGPGATLPFVY